jgi:hypothetical protein
MGELRGEGNHAMLIQYLDVCIAWLWSMFPTFQNYIIPPPSGSKWIRWGTSLGTLYVFSGYAVLTWTVLLFDPREVGSMYLRNFGNIALFYTV